MPVEFTERLERIVPRPALTEVLATFDAPRPVGFRINTLKAEIARTRTDLQAGGFRLQPVSWYDAAFQVPPEQRRALSASQACDQGRIYIQDLSSMLAPLVLAPEPGETVLDLAAAPGGKTLQMAAMMGNQGRISAVEPVKARFFRLRSNLQRHGAEMVRTYRVDGRAVGAKTPGRFDRVLLDAPCSSEARFTRLDPTSWRYWSLRKIGEAARKQRGLLESAFRALRPEGLLVYCTCAFAPEENEMAVDALLRKHPEELEVEALELPVANVQRGMVEWQGRALEGAVERCVRVLPDGRMGGFFICRLRKRPTKRGKSRTKRL